MNKNDLIFRVHAIQRMVQRHISVSDVQHVLETGETIESYPGDMPYPSRLILGWIGPRPIHVVAAQNKEEQQTIVITVYQPDPQQWQPDWKRRKKR